jgi:hypothetical protein
MDTFPKQPLEFYGHSISTRQDWKAILTEQHCPYLNRKCIKQRKSDPEQTIGACIVGYQGNPLIVCPKRFLENHQIFLDSIKLLSARQAQFFIVPEVAMPGGSVDYFLVAMRGDEVVDYLGVEIQSLDTTGSGGIWNAREDLHADRLQEQYQYGMNWKMSAKTILIQMHHKAESFEVLGKKLVLALQRQFYDYISRAFQTTHIREARMEDSVHFHVYHCVELNRQFRLTLSERKSTHVLGIERMLKLGKGAGISEEEVIQRIKAKLPSAVRLRVWPEDV